MIKVKRFLYRYASGLTTLALAMAVTTGYGQHCRTWLYQPKVPRK
ncbi:MAG: AgrD family cyclic lactone autoinducer peptide [Lachnospiraceae bacterium]